MIKELWRFLNWLDSHPDFRWKKPPGLEHIDRKPISLPKDDNGVAFQTITKETYSPDQLATILRHTDVFGKALIGVCVNCAFGQSEVAVAAPAESCCTPLIPMRRRSEYIQPKPIAGSPDLGQRPASTASICSGPK